MSAQPAMWASEQFRAVAPLGKKFCRECSKPMNARDQHARCQLCRNAGGSLLSKYGAECGACHRSFVKQKPGQQGCSLSCAQKIRSAKDKRRSAGVTRDGSRAGAVSKWNNPSKGAMTECSTCREVKPSECFRRIGKRRNQCTRCAGLAPSVERKRKAARDVIHNNHET